jgi:cytochrome c553
MDANTTPDTPRRQIVVRSLAAAIALSMTAALVACGGPAQSQSQDPSESPTWSNEQYSGSIGGDPAHGERIAHEVCAACHAPDGNSVDPKIPKLAGQKLEYLYWELRAFKQDIRKSDVMTPTLASLSYADMADVANFYSQQARKADTVMDSGLAAAGGRLFFNGMPSCAMCHDPAAGHGMPMMGMMGGGQTGAPNLNGQHASYIVDQLNRFASGERRGTVMNRVAGTLTGPDKMSVAEFLSATP